MKNAVRLIAESDNQRHDAIGLALSVTAIEALLCRKGDNLSQMFSGENMAALFQQRPQRIGSRRSGGASGFTTYVQAYSTEASSIALSGRYAKRNSRQAWSLRAMLEHPDAAIKRVGGNDENPEEFFAELRSGKYRPGQLTHVSELPLKRFWRSASPKWSE